MTTYTNITCHKCRIYQPHWRKKTHNSDSAFNTASHEMRDHRLVYGRVQIFINPKAVTKSSIPIRKINWIFCHHSGLNRKIEKYCREIISRRQIERHNNTKSYTLNSIQPSLNTNQKRFNRSKAEKENSPTSTTKQTFLTLFSGRATEENNSLGDRNQWMNPSRFVYLVRMGSAILDCDFFFFCGFRLLLTLWGFFWRLASNELVH